MAFPDYITIDPSSGNGGATVSIRSMANTGRLSTSDTFTGKAEGSLKTVDIIIKRTGTPEHIEVESSINVSDTPSQLYITGTSNTSKLTFSFNSNPIEIVPITSYKVDAISATSGVAIQGDPGSKKEFTFTVTLQIPENTTTSERTSVLKITANDTVITKTVNIIQSAAIGYLWIDREGNTARTFDFSNQDTTETMSILSNMNWIIE